MVLFPGILTPFLISIFLSLILSINSLPQNYNENLNWRYQPRSYNNNGYYANQRYINPPEYHQPSYPSSSYESYGYHRPRMQPESIALLHSRSRGPAKEVLPTPSSKRLAHGQYNASNDSNLTNQENADRSDTSNKKETTRILNSPPQQEPKASPNTDDMLDNVNDFVFPGEPIYQPPTSAPSFAPDMRQVMSMCGPDAIFCDYRDKYPSDLIKKALDKATGKYGDLLGRDQITSNVSISTRFDVTNDGTPMCGSKEKVIEPPAARNKDNEWKWIVNEGPYVQGIRVEMCDNPGSQCQMADNFPIGYKTECKQKFIYRKLLALESSGQVEPDTFRLPSCCTCIYRQETTSRFMKPSFGTSSRRK